MRVLRFLLLLSFAWTSFAATPDNDESCDISVMPAATLLLPYFEVDLDDDDGERTLFTITNATNVDRIARVTLWTDRAYPVLAFNVTLTGYDVQAIDLRELLTEGRIDAATTTRGKYSDPNADLDTSACAPQSPLPSGERARVRGALTTGAIPGECDSVGGTHENAVGYVTVDVVGLCSTRNATDPEYWTKDIRFDNVLLGEYQQRNPGAQSAQGGPLVHIRAVPEGGTSVERRKAPEEFDAGFQRTFYARYQTRLAPNLDGRQPLPSRFAARFIQDTSLKIWREGRAGLNATCADYALNAELAVEGVTVYDERANRIESAPMELPPASKLDVDTSAAPAGWMYLDLDRTQRDGFASQAWVISTMRAGDFSVDMDASALGNGCSVQVEQPREENSCDIALLPAATLLLPYFSVDLDNRAREATLFTITNTSPRDQIARVTLWTDFAFPVVSFNLSLRAFDVQSIHLYDILKDGAILSENTCGTQPNQIPEEILDRMWQAFHEGIVPECTNVGAEHDDATGYATIDVVRNCSSHSPLDEEYWTKDVAWDNVLIGDFQQVHAENRYAQGSPLVHVRAIPEGGTYRERRANPRAFDAGFPSTFYRAYQDPATPKLDGRQPLPSTFAARWVETPGSPFETLFKIWREGPRGRDATCPTWDDNAPPVAELVRFDDAENAAGVTGPHRLPSLIFITLPATSRIEAADLTIFPPLASGAASGWMYMNLDDDPATPWVGGNWVVSSFLSPGSHSVDTDAAALGNGCSPPAGYTEVTRGTEIIGPRP